MGATCPAIFFFFVLPLRSGELRRLARYDVQFFLRHAPVGYMTSLMCQSVNAPIKAALYEKWQGTINGPIMF